MIVIAMRSSTTARVSRNARSAEAAGADHGEHGEGEGDVGGGGDRPPAQGVALAAGRLTSDEDQRGHDHAADGGDDREHRLRG